MTQEEIAAALADVDSRAKSNTHRLDRMEQISITRRRKQPCSG